MQYHLNRWIKNTENLIIFLKKIQKHDNNYLLLLNLVVDWYAISFQLLDKKDIKFYCLFGKIRRQNNNYLLILNLVVDWYAISFQPLDKKDRKFYHLFRKIQGMIIIILCF